MQGAGPGLLAGLAEQGFSQGLRGVDVAPFQRAAGPRGAHISVPAHEAMLPHFAMSETPASIMNEARRIMQAPPDNYISDEQLTRWAPPGRDTLCRPCASSTSITGVQSPQLLLVLRSYLSAHSALGQSLKTAYL